MNNFNYYNPVNIIFGQNTIDNISSLIKGRRAVLITSPGFSRRGIVDKVKNNIDTIVSIIDSVPPNPTFDDLARLYKLIDHANVDIFVALGGGSVIDSAKVLSVYASCKDFQIVEDMIKQGRQAEYSLCPIIAIPTTSGTSSEITPWATVWDTVEKKKYSLHLPDLWCETAVYDPCLTLSLPKDLTIQTGLDALSHSFESIWNKNKNFISRDHAIFAIKEIISILPMLINDMSNIELRERMMYASVKAGLAFSNTQTSLAHAVSYYFTLNKGIPHGIACSITLPLIIHILKDTFPELYSLLDSEFEESLDKIIIDFFNSLDISLCLRDYGVTEIDIQNIKKSLVNNQRAANSIISIEDLVKIVDI